MQIKFTKIKNNCNKRKHSFWKNTNSERGEDNTHLCDTGDKQ